MVVCRPADPKFESPHDYIRLDLLKAAVLHDLSDPQMLGRVPRVVDGCLTQLIRLSSQSECHLFHLHIYIYCRASKPLAFPFKGGIHRGMVRGCREQNCKRHVIQPLLEETSLLWHHAAGDSPVPFLQNVKADAGLEECQVVLFYLTLACFQPNLCEVPGGRFSAELMKPMAWDSRCLDLSRPSMNFTAGLAPELKQVSAKLAEMVGPAVLPWTATTPSVVTWMLPKVTNLAIFDSSTKFCFGLQVRTQNLTIVKHSYRLTSCICIGK
jgi:hypothetical protein